MPVGLLQFASTVSTFSGGLSQFNPNTYGELQLMDIMKSGQGWGDIDPSPSGYNLDSNGYPQAIPGGTAINSLCIIPTDAERSWALRSNGDGAYKILWTSQGTLRLTGLTVITNGPGVTSSIVSGQWEAVSTTAGSFYVTCTPTTTSTLIGVKAVGAGGYIDSINYIYTDDEADFLSGKILSTKYREIITTARFGVFRYLNWGANTASNFAATTTWASRRPASYAFWLYPGEWRPSLYKGATTSSVTGGMTTYVINDGGGAPTNLQTIHVKIDANPQMASFTGVISGGTLTVSSSSGNPITVGMGIVLSSSSPTSSILITSLGTGTGGDGTYFVNTTQNVGSQSMQAVGFANLLNYNGTTKNLLNARGQLPGSQGANTGVPAANKFQTLVFDSVLDGWLLFGGGNAAPASAYVDNGIPFETYIQACIEVGCHPWICVPYLSNDAQALADTANSWAYQGDQYIQANGPPWMRAIWEPPNEQWNTQFYAYQWSNERQYVAMGGSFPYQARTPAFTVTAVDSFSVGVSCTLSVAGARPAIGALVTVNSVTVSGLNGFAGVSGYVTSHPSAGKITLDISPTGGSFAGSSGAATFTLAGSTVTLPFNVTAGQGMIFSTTGALPNGGRDNIVAGVAYYAATTVTAGNPVQLSASNGGLVLDFSGGSQSGTQTATAVIPISLSTLANNDAYGTLCSYLGQTIAASRGVIQANVKTQTQYKFALGVAVRDGDFISSTANQNARASARSFVLANSPVSPFTATAASEWSTHVTPNNYILPAALGSGSGTNQEDSLVTAFSGVELIGSISGGTMTVTSITSGGVTTSTVPTGLTLFGPINLYQALGVTITVNLGGGQYTISNASISVPAGSTIVAGNLTPVQTFIDSFQGASFNGQTAGTVLTVNSITGGCPIYVGMTIRDGNVGITRNVTISSLGTGTGGTGTYNLSSSVLGTLSARAMTANGAFDLPRTVISAQNWKTWAQGFSIQKMMCYEGGQTYDPATGGTATAKNLFHYAGNRCPSSPTYAEGTKTVLLASYAAFDALTDGTFTFEYPSCFQLDGRFPQMSNGYSVMQTIFQTPAGAPQYAAMIQYNNP